MYRIAILEHDTAMAGQLERDCRAVLHNLYEDCHIELFTRKEALLAACVEPDTCFDFLLLDTGAGGLAAAHELRLQGVGDTLVFISESGEFAMRGYDVRARHYLLKAEYQQLLAQLLAEDWQSRQGDDYFVFVNGSQRCRALLADITHLEIEGRKVAVHLPRQRLVQDGKLSELLARLPGHNFLRCHQGFAVNMRHVLELRHRELTLDNGLALPVSRTYYKDMSQSFMERYRTNISRQDQTQK